MSIFSTFATLLKLGLALQPNLSAAEEQCVVRTVYGEARGEDLTGQFLVASVINNRVKSREFPDSPCEVVNQKNQFAGNKPLPDSVDYTSVLIATVATRLAFSNLSTFKQVDGILWFTQIGENSEFHSKLASSFAYGGHHFFKQYP